MRGPFVIHRTFASQNDGGYLAIVVMGWLRWVLLRNPLAG
jgi:hypothetical protein